MTDQRVTKNTRHSYATKSNLIKKVKTPGSKLAVQIRSKRVRGPICGDCKRSLQGIKHLATPKFRATKKRERTVSRAYGGSRCATCVKSRIVRAFLVEEQKIVKGMMAGMKKAVKVEEKK